MHFIKPNRPVTKFYIHCSASDRKEDDNAATMDRWHRENGWAGIGYHFFIRKSGLIEFGRDLEKIPAAQGGHNPGTIAACIHGLEIDKFTKAELNSLVDLCWQVHDAYDGHITFHGHNEVSTKECPVIDIQKILGLDAAGNLIGSRPKKLDQGIAAVVTQSSTNGRIIKMGDVGPEVSIYQSRLSHLGYPVGKIDGRFGTLTRDSVLAFQADNYLMTDGRIGDLTKDALADASMRQVSPKRTTATLGSLATEGSRIADASIKSLTTGTAVGLSGIFSMLPIFSDTFKNLKTQIAPILEPFGGMSELVTYGLLAAVVYLTWQAWRAGKARVEDHQSGKTA